uniref:Methylase n=1 Tax=uncultured marine thaumarchaeote KM3_03_D08 TaxID=1455960 RepID=A0A075G1P0_9ARCH|nr:methylase [uncultured marine thaumarchaeote KM3_03_D08]
MKLSNLQKRLAASDPYQPAEDTFFLADHIENEKGKTALDIGTGSGFLAKILSSSFDLVIGTDININSLRQQYVPIRNRVCCNAADVFSRKFDLIICNLPYLATDEIIDTATDGGTEGFDIPSQIIRSALSCLNKPGKFIFVTSSLSNYQKLIDMVDSEGFRAKILARKKLFFEELILIQVTS